MKRLLIITSLIFSANAFASLPENPADHLLKAMKVLNEQNLKCQTDRDCNAIAYGSIACGGPNGFIVTSQKNNKRDQITTLAIMSETVEDDYNRENNVNSTCEQLLAPPVKCIQNSCVEAW